MCCYTHSVQTANHILQNSKQSDWKVNERHLSVFTSNDFKRKDWKTKIKKDLKQKEEKTERGGGTAGVIHHNFWSIGLDDIWSKKMIVWSLVLHSSLDDLVILWCVSKNEFCRWNKLTNLNKYKGKKSRVMFLNKIRKQLSQQCYIVEDIWMNGV